MVTKLPNLLFFTRTRGDVLVHDFDLAVESLHRLHRLDGEGGTLGHFEVEKTFLCRTVSMMIGQREVI